MRPAKGAGAGSVTHPAMIRVEPHIVPGQPYRARTRTVVRCGHPYCEFLVATIVQGTVDDDGRVIEMRPVDGDGVLNAFLPTLEREAQGHPADGVPGQRRHMVIWVPGMHGDWKDVLGYRRFVVTPSQRLQREIARTTPEEIERLLSEEWDRNYQEGMEMSGKVQSGYAPHGSPELERWARQRADDLRELSGLLEGGIWARRDWPNAGRPLPGMSAGRWVKTMRVGESSPVTSAHFKCPKALGTPHFNVLEFGELCPDDCAYHPHD